MYSVANRKCLEILVHPYTMVSAGSASGKKTEMKTRAEGLLGY